MKAIKPSVVAIAVFLILAPVQAFADCPTITGPHSCCGGYTWYTYTFEPSCGWPSSSNVTTTTMWCGEAAHRVAYPTTSTETVTYQYTIPTTSAYWQISLLYEFTNGGSASNFARADFTLKRNYSTISSGNIFYTNSAASCVRGGYYYVSANAGDVLEIVVTMRTANSGSYAEVSAPTLFR